MLIVTREGDRRCTLRLSKRAVIALALDRLRHILEEADDDLFLGPEVVVERRLGDVEPLGDLRDVFP